MFNLGNSAECRGCQGENHMIPADSEASPMNNPLTLGRGAAVGV
jgi:hypothetical protein